MRVGIEGALRRVGSHGPERQPGDHGRSGGIADLVDGLAGADGDRLVRERCARPEERPGGAGISDDRHGAAPTVVIVGVDQGKQRTVVAPRIERLENRRGPGVRVRAAEDEGVVGRYGDDGGRRRADSDRGRRNDGGGNGQYPANLPTPVSVPAGTREIEGRKALIRTAIRKPPPRPSPIGHGVRPRPGQSGRSPGRPGWCPSCRTANAVPWAVGTPCSPR